MLLIWYSGSPWVPGIRLTTCQSGGNRGGKIKRKEGGLLSARPSCSEPLLLFAIRDAEPLDCFRNGGLGVGRLDVSDRGSRRALDA
jgi:hypothetical protein